MSDDLFDRLDAATVTLRNGFLHAEAAAVEQAAKRIAELENALSDLVSWIPDAPVPAHWQIKAGPHGADAAIATARAIIDQTQEPST